MGEPGLALLGRCDVPPSSVLSQWRILLRIRTERKACVWLTCPVLSFFMSVPNNIMAADKICTEMNSLQLFSPIQFVQGTASHDVHFPCQFPPTLFPCEINRPSIEEGARGPSKLGLEKTNHGRKKRDEMCIVFSLSPFAFNHMHIRWNLVTYCHWFELGLNEYQIKTSLSQPPSLSLPFFV